MHSGDSDDPWTLVFTCNLHRSDITKQMASCWCPPASIKSLLLIIFQRGPSASSFKLFFFSVALQTKLTFSPSLPASWQKKTSESLVNPSSFFSATLIVPEAFWKPGDSKLFLSISGLFLSSLLCCLTAILHGHFVHANGSYQLSSTQHFNPSTPDSSLHLNSLFSVFSGSVSQKTNYSASRYHLNERERG